MTLGGSAVTASNHTGAAASDGKFVPLTAAGMSVTWSNVSVPSAGQYTFWVHYANAGSSGGDNPFALTVNGKPAVPSTINLKNWAGSTNWDQAWQRSYASVTLNAGSNTIELSYGGGSNAGVNVDQFAVTTSPNTPPWN
ncbi:carbohydrate-binding protein [Streptacidiphilus sp. 4-A2]|nr:carbohydrate-binding protein [Streptacidiphilus sp. 4-A2]